MMTVRLPMIASAQSTPGSVEVPQLAAVVPEVSVHAGDDAAPVVLGVAAELVQNVPFTVMV